MTPTFQRINYLIRPGLILLSLLFYLLGTGISRYLGSGPNWGIFWLGIGWILSLQLACQFFQIYFQRSDPAYIRRKNQLKSTRNNGKPVDTLDQITGRNLQLAAFTSLTATALFTVILIAQGLNLMGMLLFFLVGFGAGFFYSAPPLRLESSGYGELVYSSLVTLLVPAFSYYIQAESIHRLIAMSSFPLLGLGLAMQIAQQISMYASDLSFERKNLTIRLGWNNAMTIHNMLILGAYLLMGIAAAFGFPDFAWIAGLLSIPAGLLQIWQMWRIGQGGRPNWSALNLNAIVTFAGLAYLFTYSFWTH